LLQNAARNHANVAQNCLSRKIPCADIALQQLFMAFGSFAQKKYENFVNNIPLQMRKINLK
ncbi:MAG: hypothetical protein K2G32_06385, partial [Oscillospiraceae bacterium]|nr:hypothetical protein [Oscillospiraceae bacterium]